jgi:hypothetical protein
MAGPVLSAVARIPNVRHTSATCTAGGTDGAGTLSWAAGDTVLAIGSIEDRGQSIGLPTVTGLTFTQVAQEGGPGNACEIYLWKAVAAGSGSGKISATGSGNLAWALAATVVTAASNTGTVAPVHGSGTVLTYSITRTAAHSAMFGGLADWGAGSPTGAAIVPVTNGTLDEAATASGRYTDFTGHWADQGAAGASNYGVSGVTASGANYVYMFVEILAASSGQTVNLGVATETDAGLTLADKTKHKTQGDPVESNVGIALSKSKAHTLAATAEADTALSITHSRHRTLGQPVETETAYPHGSNTKHKTLGDPVESNIALALARAKKHTLGDPVEADSATPASKHKSKVLGVALEADSALPVSTSGHHFLNVGIGAETDAGSALSKGKKKAVADTVEVDAGLALGKAKHHTLGEPIETDIGESMARAKRKTLGIALEADSGLPLTITGHITVNLGLAGESDSGLALHRTKHRTGGAATELDAVAGVARAKLTHLGVGNEADTGLTLRRVKYIQLHIAAETEAALSLHEGGKAELLGIASETDTALQLFVAARDIEVAAGPYAFEVMAGSATLDMVDAGPSTFDVYAAAATTTLESPL